MARDYDTQLLESVAVRRRRLRDALVFGQFRTRRTLDEGINKIVIGLCIAAVICAGCVGWSLVKTQLLKQKSAQAAQSASPATSPTSTAPDVPIPAGWVGAQVTVPMLRDALTRAAVPASLYVLPGRPRPSSSRVSSYYVLAKSGDQFTGGIVEGSQGRLGAQFGNEDEACRWLYGELVIKETPPVRLTVPQEQQAAQQSAAIAQDVRNKVARNAGAAMAYPLTAGSPLDAFGQESGAELFPDGTPFAQRGQPAAARATLDPRAPKNYYRYRVLRPFQVNASIVPTQSIGRSGGRGGGVRLTLNSGLFTDPPGLLTVRWLVRNGYLGRVAVATVPK